MKVSDEAVDAAVKAYFRKELEEASDWLTEYPNEPIYASMREALEAALPFLK
jgi:hypothetical protein